MKIFRHFSANEEFLDYFPFKRELSMEAYILENESILKLDDNLFNEVDVLGSEISIKDGQVTKNKDGRIDILVKYPEDTFGLIELKHDVELDQKALSQLEDYLKEKDQLLKVFQKNTELQGIDNDEDKQLLTNPKWIGILVGTEIDSDLAKKLTAGYMFDLIPIAALVIKRFKAKNGCVYVTTDRYFKQPSNRDMSKYIFNGIARPKNRTVLAVVEQYLKEHPEITTTSQLERVFPKNVQSPSEKFGVFNTQQFAIDVLNSHLGRRFFINDDEILLVGTEKIAVCTQWGGDNFKRFIDHVKSTIGFKLEKQDG